MRFRLTDTTRRHGRDARALGVRLRRAFRGLRRRGDWSVVLVSDAEIRRLNRRFLHCDRTTDVLAFPLAAGGPGRERGLAGEILVSVDTARREAAARGGTRIGELVLYSVHGVLHLLGYDDHDPDDRRRMRRREAALLARAGLGDVFAGTGTERRRR